MPQPLLLQVVDHWLEMVDIDSYSVIGIFSHSYGPCVSIIIDFVFKCNIKLKQCVCVDIDIKQL